MKSQKIYWIGIVCALGGCTQLLELDQEYQPSETGSGAMAGSGGTGGACDGVGTCKTPNGTTCLTGTTCSSGNCIEGYCCDTTCSQECRACNISGLEGICSVVPEGYSDDTCLSPKSCDGTNGANNCDTKYPMGHPCTVDKQCGSGMCVDGVCCNSSCRATCQACNIVDSAGTCVNVPIGQEDPVATTDCTGVNSCNGAGDCLLDNGQPCSSNTQCVSNKCTGMPMKCQ